jgi:surfeit locus 1 family protein
VRAYRKLLWPTLATLIALAILLNLGFWQLKRKEWKGNLVAQIEARAYGPANPLPAFNDWSSWQAQSGEFTKVTLTGIFDHTKEVLVHGLTNQGLRGVGVSGFFVITPLQLEDGSIVLINRGFVPPEFKARASRVSSEYQGLITITGLLRQSEVQTAFVPDNTPQKGEWFTRDIAAIAASQNLKRVAPFIIDADNTPQPGGWPLGGRTNLNPPNNHMSYALTWFGIAGTLLGVFGFYAWGQIRNTKPA